MIQMAPKFLIPGSFTGGSIPEALAEKNEGNKSL
jgi:hypothetical protein